MNRLPIEAQYAIEDWSKLQLFSLNTPNGIKISVALEELDLPYEPHTVNILNGDQHTEAYQSISPNGKIPVLIDPDGPNGPLTIMESGAILLHLADKTKKLIPQDPVIRSECVQWLFMQVGHIGPMFGQFGHFHKFARDKTQDTYALERYLKETQRLLGVLESRLAKHSFLAGEEYTIADIATFPWVEVLSGFYGAGDVVQMTNYPAVNAWLEGITARPATEVGRKVCSLQ